MPLTHGTTTGYSYYRCRCDLCRAAVAEYNRQRKAEKRAGTWQPKKLGAVRVSCTGPECERLATYRRPQRLCNAHSDQVERGKPLTPIRRQRRITDGTKECSRCDQVLPVSEFNRRGPKHLQPECKACQSILNRATRYRITFDEAKALIEGACATCGSMERLHVDHCHETGKVRGVLCHNCNTVLTKHMTPTTLRRLADYLES